jgi:putative ABC transport system substrate-binding protein
MRRRNLMTVLASTAVYPLTAGVQQKPTRVVGFLSGVSPESYTPFVAAFRSGLNDTGYTEGKNLAIEFRWAQDRPDRLHALAADLVSHDVEVVVATGGSPLAAKQATATIPIVFVAAGDPVATGLVSNFNHPGGNVTGVLLLVGELIPKRLQLLHELVPSATIIAMLVNPNYRLFPDIFTAAREAAVTMGLQLPIIEAKTARDFEPAFARIAELGAGALLVSTNPLFTEHREQLVALAAHYAVPASYEWREYVAVGGLISYGASIAGVYRQAGLYTGRILNGDKVGDLPVVQPTKLELVVNLKTATALGLTVPPSILARADEVIE